MVETLKKYRLYVFNFIGLSCGCEDIYFNESKWFRILSIKPISENISKNEIRFSAELVR